MCALICVAFSLPPGVRGWLRPLLVALPGLFSLYFFNDGPDIKLFILVDCGLIFFVCCLAHRGSTIGFPLLVPVVLFNTPGSPGVGRNTLFLSSPHLCFIIAFICDLFFSRDDPLMS